MSLKAGASVWIFYISFFISSLNLALLALNVSKQERNFCKKTSIVLYLPSGIEMTKLTGV